MSPPRRVLVASGPNLQLLGRREPAIYGTTTLAEIHERLRGIAAGAQAEVDARQSNHEGDLIAWVGEAGREGFAGVLLNPGGYTHTSVALLDAIKASGVPVIEVHLSNPDAREPFRRRSYAARGCLGRVAGFGPRSYELALRGLLLHLSDENRSPHHEG